MLHIHELPKERACLLPCRWTDVQCVCSEDLRFFTKWRFELWQCPNAMYRCIC